MGSGIKYLMTAGLLKLLLFLVVPMKWWLNSGFQETLFFSLLVYIYAKWFKQSFTG